jgi:hypothetical protein
LTSAHSLRAGCKLLKNQQLKEIPNGILLCLAVQPKFRRSNKKLLVKNWFSTHIVLSDNLYYLIIQHLSSPMDAELKVFHCIHKAVQLKSKLQNTAT